MVKEISVNISKKIGRVGEFGSDMVSASITMSVEEDADVKLAYQEAWEIVKEEVEEQEKLLQDIKDIKESVDPAWIGPPESTTTTTLPKVDLTSPSFCGVHKVEMKERVSKFGKFYSHSQQKPDGSWEYCQGKGFGVK